MANLLTRFDPRQDLAPFDMFRRFEDMLANGNMPSLSDASLPLDIAETEQAYKLRASMPGVRREDIRVSVHGNRVTVEAETRREEEKKDEKIIRTERYVGRQFRSVMLDHDIEEAKADARYHDGILELTLPKKAGRNGRTLAVH